MIESTQRFKNSDPRKKTEKIQNTNKNHGTKN